MRRFVVWVGGVEVNDRYLTQMEALQLALDWLNEGYDDVQVDSFDEGAEGKWTSSQVCSTM
jgi:hypothetical protein